MKLEVEAPTDLASGYPLEVEVHGTPVIFTVPHDVKAGETIPFEYDESQSSGAPLQLSKTNTKATQNHLAPLGRWRNELCGCFSLCFVSSLWWNACCFPCIVWGQLLTRLKLNAFACPASPTWVNKTFFIVVGLVVLVWFLAFLLPVIVAINYDCSEVSYSTTVNPYDDYNPYYDYNPYDDYYPYTTYGTTTYYECIYNEIPMGIVVPWLIICFVYWIYLLVMLTRLRGQYRRQYQIAGSCCDDCCCMYCCGFCNIIQMARHTHDEHIYKYQCCNTTGLPPDAPEIV